MQNLVVSKDTVIKAYNPKTAFGNLVLIKAIEEANQEAEEKEKIKKCGLCDEDGEVDIECENCDGRGSITAKCDHEGGHY